MASGPRKQQRRVTALGRTDPELGRLHPRTETSAEEHSENQHCVQEVAMASGVLMELS